jgi:hypothetical protein
MGSLEPLYARRQQSDRFTTSPDQYTLSGKFGDYSPRFTIKRKYPDKQIVYNVDYVGRVEPNNVPRSPRYTIACRHAPPMDPDGLAGPTYSAPPFGSGSPRIAIHRRFPEKEQLTAAQQTAKYRFVPPPAGGAAVAPEADTGVPKYSIAGLLSARSQQPIVQEPPEIERSTPRTRTITKAIAQREERALCGPVGRPEARMLPPLARGVMHRIQNRETADFVR